MPSKRFKEKTVIITGAGSDIGHAMTLHFAQEGANVVLVGRTQEQLMETAEMLPEDSSWIHNDNYMTITCDINNIEQVQKMVAAVAERFDHIDILVNNIGKVTELPVTELSVTDCQESIDINLTGTLYVSQAVMPYLIASEGSIINVSSPSGMAGDWMSAYSEAKEVVGNLTRTMALDHGEDGVRVNAVNASAINPNVTKTDMTTSIPKNDEKIQQFLAHCPLKRIATPDDIASAIIFLASDEASMITGVNLPVDGGVSASNGQPQF